MRERDSHRRHSGRPTRGDERRLLAGKQFGDKTFGKRSGDPRGASRHRRAHDRDSTAVLYGWHTVKAALENPERRFHRLLATENAVRRLTEDGVTFPIAPTLARPEDIAAVAGATAVHQGLYAEADPLESPELEDVVTDGGIVLA